MEASEENLKLLKEEENQLMNKLENELNIIW